MFKEMEVVRKACRGGWPQGELGGDPSVRRALLWQLRGRQPTSSAGGEGSASGSGRSLQEEMAARSSMLAWETAWVEEPGGLQSVGRKEWTWLSDWVCVHWSDKMGSENSSFLRLFFYKSFITVSKSTWTHIYNLFKGWKLNCGNHLTMDQNYFLI